MTVALAIVALAILGGLCLLSLKQQRERAAAEKQTAGARSQTGDAQHDRSMSRRAAVRSGPDQHEAGSGATPVE
jgi:hypothetical protein